MQILKERKNLRGIKVLAGAAAQSAGSPNEYHVPGTFQERNKTEWLRYLRLIDSCITQLKAQGPSRTCNESKEEEGVRHLTRRGVYFKTVGFNETHFFDVTSKDYSV